MPLVAAVGVVDGALGSLAMPGASGLLAMPRALDLLAAPGTGGASFIRVGSRVGSRMDSWIVRIEMS